MRYIYGIDNHVLEYNKNDTFILFGYKNANYGGSLDSIRSTIRYVFFLNMDHFNGEARNKA